jgi:Bacteriophage tail sheath protein
MDDVPQSPGPAIQAVPTSIAGFVGAAAGGPEGEAVLVTSVVDYQRAFGTVAGELSRAVGLFFANGGTRAYVVRTEGEIDGALGALEGLPVGLLALPETGGLDANEAARVTAAAAALCLRRRWFLVVDPPGSLRPAAIETWARRVGSQSNAAVYMPRLRLPDGTETAASGAVAGVVARTDIQRGVWVAPAGLQGRVQGVADVTRQLSDKAVQRAAGAGVNPIRRLDTGLAVWGARTLSVDQPEWKYVSVRRLALFLESSIDQGIQWAVFEPNGEQLWAQVRLTVEEFMLQVFRQGAFQGARAEDAYFVRCDRTTMTQDDIDNGRLVVLIGFAPVVPAEFITIRIA